MALILDGVLALSQGVPQLDGLVSAGRHDLPVVSREGHGEDVLGVVLEPAGGLAGAEVPQPEVLVPGPGQGEVAVGGENHVGHEVGVAVEPLLGHSVLAVLPSQLPDNQRLVTTGGEDHIGVLRVGGDLSHPAIVAPQSPSELQGLGHDNFSRPFLL